MKIENKNIQNNKYSEKKTLATLDNFLKATTHLKHELILLKKTNLKIKKINFCLNRLSSRKISITSILASYSHPSKKVSYRNLNQNINGKIFTYYLIESLLILSSKSFVVVFI